jgi:hypothetical protein
VKSSGNVMDIFTTVLTRVVPVPIKPANLKVKALLKEAATSKLKEDLDHLENHDYYFDSDKNKHKESEQDNSVTEADESSHATLEAEDKKHAHDSDESVTESKDGIKHLDLYV